MAFFFKYGGSFYTDGCHELVSSQFHLSCAPGQTSESHQLGLGLGLAEALDLGPNNEQV